MAEDASKVGRWAMVFFCFRGFWRLLLSSTLVDAFLFHPPDAEEEGSNAGALIEPSESYQ